MKIIQSEFELNMEIYLRKSTEARNKGKSKKQIAYEQKLYEENKDEVFEKYLKEKDYSALLRYIVIKVEEYKLKSETKRKTP